MKHTLLALSLLALPASAQTDWLNTQLEFRSDYTCKTQDGQDTDKGFKGQYLNLKLNGKINKQFSYAYRQRFSKDMFRDGGFLNGTDYLYLNYRPNERWNISAGKQFTWIGGFEYDKAPIDVYQYTEYCQFIECYGYGLSVDYNFTPHDNLLLQVAQSAFASHKADFYSYNAKWTGQHGWFSSIYSFGIHEYDRGYESNRKWDKGYLSCFALGNRFDFGNKAHLLIDYTNRFDLSKSYKDWDGVPKPEGADNFFGDYTLMTELHYQPAKEVNLFGHYCHTHNQANYGDPTVKPNTSLNTVGIGAEYFPMKGDPDVRLHAAYFCNMGKNGNKNGVIQGDQQYLTIGLTFRVNVNKVRDRFKE